MSSKDYLTAEEINQLLQEVEVLDDAANRTNTVTERRVLLSNLLGELEQYRNGENTHVFANKETNFKNHYVKAVTLFSVFDPAGNHHKEEQFLMRSLGISSFSNAQCWPSANQKPKINLETVEQLVETLRLSGTVFKFIRDVITVYGDGVFETRANSDRLLIRFLQLAGLDEKTCNRFFAQKAQVHYARKEWFLNTAEETDESYASRIEASSPIFVGTIELHASQKVKNQIQFQTSWKQDDVCEIFTNKFFCENSCICVTQKTAERLLQYSNVWPLFADVQLQDGHLTIERLFFMFDGMDIPILQ